MGAPLPIYALLQVFSKNSSPLNIYCVLTLVWAQYLHELFHLILVKKIHKQSYEVAKNPHVTGYSHLMNVKTNA